MKLDMKRFEFKRLRTRIPALIVLLGCFTVIAATADYSQMSVRASTSHVTNKKTIVLDAGHGGTDSGAVGINGELEKNINLAIVRDLSDMLTLSGFNVVLTRDSDISIHDEGVKGTREQKVSDMKNRLDIINKYGDCLFLSIHQNKFTEPEYFGAQIFYTANNPDNRMIAQIMQDNFKTIQPGNDRQIKQEGDELYLFKNTKIPAVLIECGFLSNPDDAANLSDTDYQRKVAYTIYNGILTYLTSKPWTMQVGRKFQRPVFPKTAVILQAPDSNSSERTKKWQNQNQYIYAVSAVRNIRNGADAVMPAVHGTRLKKRLYSQNPTVLRKARAAADFRFQV